MVKLLFANFALLKHHRVIDRVLKTRIGRSKLLYLVFNAVSHSFFVVSQNVFMYSIRTLVKFIEFVLSLYIVLHEN